MTRVNFVIGFGDTLRLALAEAQATTNQIIGTAEAAAPASIPPKFALSTEILRPQNNEQVWYVVIMILKED
jgi:hypothetical protein